MVLAPRPNPAAPPAEDRALVADWADPYDFSARREWIKLCFLLAITAIAYAPIFSASFLWQDDRTITHNPSIRSLRAVGHTWLHPRSVPLYRPLADTLLTLEYSLWGNWNPTGYHIINLALHLLATMLVWRVLRKLKVPAAIVGAALFALHPIAVHAVAWASQQPVLLASVFALMCCLAWLRWNDPDQSADPDVAGIDLGSGRRTLFALITFALFLAAMLCDAGTACGLAGAFPLLAWQQQRRVSNPIGRRGMLLLQAVGLLGTIAIVVLRADPFAPPLPIGQAVALQVFKLIVPYPLLLTYAPLNPVWRYGLTVLVGATVIAAVAMRRRLPRGMLIAAGAYLSLLLPAVLLGDSVFDAQQYLARAALLALAAAAVTPLVPEREEDDDARHAATRPIVATIVVILLAAGTFWQTTFCQNDAIAWSHVLAYEPDSRVARLELGDVALARHDAPAAIEQFSQLVARDPNDADAQLRLGEVLMEQGNLNDAMAQFEKAATLRPNDPVVWRHRAAALARKDDVPAAVADYEKALSLDPRDRIARNNLAALYVRQGQIDRAVDAYEQILCDDSRNAVVHVNLARLFFDTGRFTESADHLKQAVAIDPSNFDAYMTAGDALMKLKDFHQAQRMFQQAVQLHRDNALALNALGVALAAQGRWNEAIYQFGRALDVDPNYAPAKQNLDAARRDREAAATQPQ